jgi:hypothetical protein
LMDWFQSFFFLVSCYIFPKWNKLINKFLWKKFSKFSERKYAFFFSIFSFPDCWRLKPQKNHFIIFFKII